MYKSIFIDHWLFFAEAYPLLASAYIRNEINKMLRCGTVDNGYAVMKCLNCGKDHHIVHFSCKGKGCLQCGKRKARDALDKIGSRLMSGVNYRQVMLSIPMELRDLFQKHPDHSQLYADFMNLSHNCLLQVIREYLLNDNIKIACITFIHTHGRDGKYNPHLHIILGEGAYSVISKEWLTFNHLPLQLLRKKWQYHLLSYVKETFPDEKRLVSELWDNNPNGLYVFPGEASKVPTKNYSKLIKYLTKYLSSPPMGLSRLIKYDGDNIHFCYQSHKTKKREYKIVDAVTFIQLMVQHILPKNFHTVRYYGVQAHSVFRKLYMIIAELAGDLVDRMLAVRRIQYAEFFLEVVKRNPLTCRECGHHMELWQLVHPDKGVIWDLQDRISRGVRL